MIIDLLPDPQYKVISLWLMVSILGALQNEQGCAQGLLPYAL